MRVNKVMDVPQPGDEIRTSPYLLSQQGRHRYVSPRHKHIRIKYIEYHDAPFPRAKCREKWKQTGTYTVNPRGSFVVCYIHHSMVLSNSKCTWSAKGHFLPGRPDRSFWPEIPGKQPGSARREPPSPGRWVCRAASFLLAVSP